MRQGRLSRSLGADLPPALWEIQPEIEYTERERDRLKVPRGFASWEAIEAWLIETGNFGHSSRPTLDADRRLPRAPTNRLRPTITRFERVTSSPARTKDGVQGVLGQFYLRGGGSSSPSLAS